MKKDIKDKEKLSLIEEKQSLECTLVSLSEEVEFLSQKNEQFLREIRNKDFYEEYKAATDDLNQLRKAHISLIDLIEGKELNIDDRIHPMTDTLLRKWKRENFLSASVGRMHSNSVGTINGTKTSPHLMPQQVMKLNKAGSRKANQQNLTADRIMDDGDLYNGQMMRESNYHKEQEGSTLSRIFNCGGFDNTENNYELSIHQEV